MKISKKAEIGIIGGSGFYDLVKGLREIKVETPYGPPSEKIAIGTISGKKVAFLPRHNRTHDLPPHKINYRANIWALHSLGVKEIVTVTACGSLQTKIKRGDFVILDQFIDRTRGRIDSFYQGPIVTHISSAQPYCPRLRKLLWKKAKKLKIKSHKNGVVVVINGPRFSTTAESQWFTKSGWSVVNMTQYPEVILARELEMCYSTVALVTDYDAGIIRAGKAKPVSVKVIVDTFKKNINSTKKLFIEMFKDWPEKRDCNCPNALEGARF